MGMDKENAEKLLEHFQKNKVDESVDLIEYIENFLKGKYEKELNTFASKIVNGIVELRNTDMGIKKQHQYININKETNVEIFTGKCHRQLFFEINNVPASEKFDISKSQIIELTEMLRHKFVENLRESKLLVKKKTEYILAAKDFKINGYIDGILINTENGNEELFFFETVKNGFYVFGSETMEGTPMSHHILKILPAIVYFKKKANLIYQDKGNMKMKKFTISLNDKFEIFINNVPYNAFNFKMMMDNVNELINEIKDYQNKIIPAKSYTPYKKEHTFYLQRINEINSKQAAAVNYGTDIYPFECEICRYFNLCKNTPNESYKGG